jgi:hypothetical protein
MDRRRPCIPYRRFLEELGCGDIAGEEFFGIIGDDFVNS